MYSLTALSWALAALAAVLIGFGKTGILGVSLFAVGLMATRHSNWKLLAAASAINLAVS